MGLADTIERYENITLVYEPVVDIIAEPALVHRGLDTLRDWVSAYTPECGLVSGSLDPLFGLIQSNAVADEDTDAELLVELAGRKCYNAFGAKASPKSNKDYIAHTQSGDIPHASILYHPKFTFFIANVSRKLSHQLIRNYVGSDRSEEGSPSQESTRYTHHPGWYVVPPYMQDKKSREFGDFRRAMAQNYSAYTTFLERAWSEHEETHGSAPKGLVRKRIYEAAAYFLAPAACTSWIWTTNPIALAKLIRERENRAADQEIQVLATKWRELVTSRYPNLFPQPWMGVV